MLYDVTQVCVLIAASVGISMALQRWGSMTLMKKPADRRPASRRPASTAQKPASAQDDDDDIPEPELVSPAVAPAAARSGNSDRDAQTVKSLSTKTAGTVASSSASYAGQEAQSPDDRSPAPPARDFDADAILNEALDNEGDADHLLDELLDEAEHKNGESSRPSKGGAAAGSEKGSPLAADEGDHDAAASSTRGRLSADALMRSSGSNSKASSALQSHASIQQLQQDPQTCPTSVGSKGTNVASTPRSAGSIDDLLDAALEEAGAHNSMLDECLDSIPAAKPAAAGSPAHHRHHHHQHRHRDHQEQRNGGEHAQAPRSGTKNRHGAGGGASDADNDAVHGTHSSSQEDPKEGGAAADVRSALLKKPKSDSEKPEIVFSPAFRQSSRSSPDLPRAETLLRMAKELLALQQPQAALDAACAALRFVDSDCERLQEEVRRVARAAFEQCDAGDRFAAEAEPWL